MRVRRHVLRPEMECCESRALLSGGPVSAPAAAVAQAEPIRVIQLNGTILGHYIQNVRIPDVGANDELNGSGKLLRIGDADLSGSLHSIGFIARGNAQGTLVLASAKGTITLSLTGADQQDGPKGLPSAFRFTVTNGTGKYRTAHDEGTATLVISPGNSNSPMDTVIQGKFKLVLKSFPVPTV
jgi:hypothetical protein